MMTHVDLEQARHNMIEQQVRPWDVLDDRVLELMLRVPREDFVPTAFHEMAFGDFEVPLGHDEVMMPPKLEGRMLQSLRIRPEDTILEVGTGSGYVTALLAHLGRHVTSVDIHPEFTQSAERKLMEHGITNVTLETGDAAEGWPGDYSVIAVTGSLPMLPDAFKQALRTGGRLFAIVGDAPTMEALLVTRLSANDWRTESLFETVVPPLRGAPQPQRFTL